MKQQPNEEKIYEKVVSDGFTRDGDPSFVELLALAKSIRQKKGCGEKNIIKYLTAFCIGEDEFFDPVTTSRLLKSVAREAIKNAEFRTINFPIKIMADEISSIRKVKNYKLQLLFLASIVVAKSTGNPKIFSDSPNKIYHIIEVSGQKYSYKLFIEKLSSIAHSKNIFTFVANKYHFYSVLCDSTGGVSVEIKDEEAYYNLSEVYRNFIGGELGWCKQCSKEYVKQGRNHSYCVECSKDRTAIRNRNRKKKQ